MSEFVQHEPCPSCGSEDNLARYDDGHAYCFGCHHVEMGPLLSQLQEKVKNNNKKDDFISLPADYSYSIPDVAFRWLRKYDITPDEIRKHSIGWSNDGIYLSKKDLQLCPLLIFPFYDDEKKLLAWQGRYFGSDPKGTKYYTRGARNDFLPIINYGGSGNSLVVCEDCVSAYKLARVVPSMPLLGSHLNEEKALKISRLFAQLTIWLDYDKAGDSMKQAKWYEPYFQQGVKVIITERDPKEYSTEELTKCL